MISVPFVEAVLGWMKSMAPEDGVSKLVTRFTSTVFIFFSVFLGGGVYMGKSFEAVLPQTYSAPWEEFGMSRCFWAEELIYEKKWLKIRYYPYTPLYCFVAAIAFISPQMIWRWMLSVCGMPLTSICQMVKIMNGEKMERCGTAIRDISDLIEEKAGTKYTFYFCGFRRPTLYQCYILVKLYTFAMMIGQFVVLAFMFDHNKGWTWGWEAAWNFVDYGRKSTFDIDSFFPNQVFCNFTFKEIYGGYPRKETIELLLPSWIMLLIVIHLVDFVVIVMRYIMWSKKVKQLLMVSRVERDSDDDGRGRRMVEYYTKHVITPIHCLVYRFMGHCCGVRAQEVAKYMYIKWKSSSNNGYMTMFMRWQGNQVVSSSDGDSRAAAESSV